MHSSVLERTESDLSKINWLRGVILLLPIVLVPWGRFPLCHTPIRPISAFPGSDLILRCGLRDHVITRFASGGIRARLRNKVISLCYFRFLSVFLKFFSVCVHLVFHICLCDLVKKKEKKNRKEKEIQSVEKKQKREKKIRREIEVIDESVAAQNTISGKHKKPHRNRLKTNIPSIWVEI